jgi:nucleoside-diphosphate-sugar epimerase
MKVAVTGSTGFIGQHVLAELAKHPIDIVPVARRSPVGQFPPTLPNVVRLDVHDASADAFYLMGSPDVLVHLAWEGLPNYKSLHHFEQELPAHYRFLQGLVRSGLKSLVVAGTCFEYGMQSGPLSEETEARPSNPYGFAKDTLRRQLEYLRVAQPFALVWARLFYVYGKGQSEQSLLGQLKNAVARGDKVFNMSDGEQLRDYLSVTDLAKCIVMLALAGADIGVVNVCSGKPVSVRSLVENCVAENGWSIDLKRGACPCPDYEPLAFWGTRTKLDQYVAVR